MDTSPPLTINCHHVSEIWRKCGISLIICQESSDQLNKAPMSFWMTHEVADMTSLINKDPKTGPCGTPDVAGPMMIDTHLPE